MEKDTEIKLEVEQLEERIAPDATGSLGYEGQPGNQGALESIRTVSSCQATTASPARLS